MSMAGFEDNYVFEADSAQIYSEGKQTGGRDVGSPGLVGGESEGGG